MTHPPVVNNVPSVNTVTDGYQSPPKLLLLADGRTLFVWVNDGLSDDLATMEIQARIFNADGTPATGQISLGSLPAVDGFDGYDWDNLDLDLLNDGRVMLSYVRNTVDGGAGNFDEPIYTILQPTANNLTVVSGPTEIQQNDTTTFESPPVTTVLDNGNVLFVWSKNGDLDDTTTMTLQGRILNPTTGQWVTNEFAVGNIAVDGTDSADISNLTVTQLAGGNIVVGYARSNAEPGFTEPVYRVLDQNGNTIFAGGEIEGTDNEVQHTPWESPPAITALSDGRWMAVWVNDGYSDDITSMTLEGRIFNANGTPATGDFRIGATAVDGSDGADNAHVTITELAPGRVVVGYAETNATGGTTLPFFSIVDTTTGSVIATDVAVAQSPDHPWGGPPVIEALGNSGYFVAVFADGDQYSGGATALNYRIFDVNGNPVTDEIELTSSWMNAALSGLDGFDWDNVDISYNPTNSSFTIGWVGQNDGSVTGVYTSGPISVSGLVGGAPFTGNEVVTGGETNETTGDLLDFSGATASLAVNFTAAETGTVRESGTGDTLAFNEIERIALGSGDDTVNGGIGADVVDGGAGNDSLSGNGGNDSLLGGGGNDSLSGGDGSDTLVGGIGNDSLVGGGQDDTFLLDPGFGTDTITGGETGEVVGDTIDARTLTENVTVTLSGPEAGTLTGASGTATFAEIENILLGSGNDTVTGGAGNDTVNGGAGNDSLAGGGGNDSLIGGTGNDTLDGGDNNDTLDGGIGNDSLIGGGGNDSLSGGDGSDTLVGGPGNDTLDGGANDDDFVLAAGDVAQGGDGDDEFRFDPTIDVAGTITVTGGEGAEEAVIDPTNNPAGRIGDTLDLRNLQNVVVTPNAANPESGTVTYTTAGGQIVTIAYSQIENILVPQDGTVDGTAGGDDMGIGFTDPQGDQIDGADGLNDLIAPGAGNDTVDAGLGDDTVNAGTGNDSVFGNDGNDILNGEAGNDTITGGQGNDTIDGGADNDSLAGGADNDQITGGTGDDVLDGNTGDDTLSGGDNNDTLFGGIGNDLLNGDAGRDSLEGNDGNDILNGGDDADTLQGNAGNDTLNGDAGNDSIVGGDGRDLADGGDGNDFINTRSTAGTPDDAGALSDPDTFDDRDTVFGGAGDDTILAGDDADLIVGGSGNDSIDGGFDNDTIDGGLDDDTILGGEGRDSISGGGGNDLLYGGIETSTPTDIVNAGGADPLPVNNADTISGGDGNDTIFGFDDNDSLVGDDGNDSLDGGIDDDTLVGGLGNDTLLGGDGTDSLVGGDGVDSLVGGAGADQMSGGAGPDRFVVEGADVISDFDATTGITGTVKAPNAPNADNDFVDLSGYYNDANLAVWNATPGNPQYANPLAWLRADQNNDGILQGAQGLRINNVATGAAIAGGLLNLENTGVVCFTRGTMILTAEGERDIATLAIGDLIYTADHGYQPLRWIGSMTVAAKGRFAPIAIEAGALGNRRRLKVSPQHRMLLTGWQAELLYDEPEVLVAAKMLVNDTTIRVEEGETVEYFHMLFDAHEIVFAEGCPSESFHPGHQGWGALAEAAREEILSLFPMLEEGNFTAYGPSARRTLTAAEARVLTDILLAGDGSPEAAE